VSHSIALVVCNDDDHSILVYITSVYVGLTFWKSPRRKLYAVAYDDIRGLMSCPSRSFPLTPSRELHQTDSSDEDEDLLPPKEKKRRNEKMLQSIKDELVSLKDTVVDVMSLTPESFLPLGLRRVIRDTFKCQICQSTANPPIIVTKCCKNILGCQV